MMTATRDLPIEAMTDEEVAETYLELVTNRQLVDEQLAKQRLDLKVNLLNGTDLNHDGIQIVMSRFDTMVPGMLQQMKEVTGAVARELFTIAEMKVMIQFMQEHPDLHRKNQVFQMKSMQALMPAQQAFNNELVSCIESTGHLRRYRTR